MLLTISEGCRKRADNSLSIQPGFSAQINNVKWIPKTFSAHSGYSSACMGCPQDFALNIQVFDSSYEYMRLDIHYWNGSTGTFAYPSYSSDKHFSFFYDPRDTGYPSKGGYYSVYGSQGSLIITKLSSNNIQGTFSGSLADIYKDSIYINGEFNIPLNE